MISWIFALFSIWFMLVHWVLFWGTGDDNKAVGLGTSAIASDLFAIAWQMREIWG